MASGSPISGSFSSQSISPASEGEEYNTRTMILTSLNVSEDDFGYRDDVADLDVLISSVVAKALDPESKEEKNILEILSGYYFEEVLVPFFVEEDVDPEIADEYLANAATKMAKVAMEKMVTLERNQEYIKPGNIFSDIKLMRFSGALVPKDIFPDLCAAQMILAGAAKEIKEESAE